MVGRPARVHLTIEQLLELGVKKTALLAVLAILAASVAGCLKGENAAETTPIISGVCASEPIQASAVVTWTTDVPATSQVEYGLTTAYGSATSLNESLVTSHSATLTDLEPDSVYHFRVRSEDAKGSAAISEDYTFGWSNVLTEVIPKASPYNVLTNVTERLPEGYFVGFDAESLIAWIEQGLQCHPPDEGRRRDAFFLALDIAMVASSQESYSPMVSHRIDTTRGIYRMLEKSDTGEDLVIYKLYNEGTIIQAAGVSFGVDIVLAHPENDDLAPHFAEGLDALFVTHEHKDHYDHHLAEEFRKQGKPVIVAKDDSSVPLGSATSSGTVRDIRWTAFRGAHVSMRFSGFFLFKVGEWSILHSGDNTRWIDFADSDYAKELDVFLFKPESMYAGSGQDHDIQEALEETLERMRPRFLIPHHLLEIGHGMYAYGYDMAVRLYDQASSGTEVKLLHWGESFRVPP